MQRKIAKRNIGELVNIKGICLWSCDNGPCYFGQLVGIKRIKGTKYALIRNQSEVWLVKESNVIIGNTQKSFIIKKVISHKKALGLFGNYNIF